jgi:hypothetical protein
LNNAVKQPGRAARIGLWLLAAYGVLLGLSTLSHQPPVADFDAYARYVTTDVFLLGHLVPAFWVPPWRYSASWL